LFLFCFDFVLFCFVYALRLVMPYIMAGQELVSALGRRNIRHRYRYDGPRTTANGPLGDDELEDLVGEEVLCLSGTVGRLSRDVWGLLDSLV